MKDETTLQRIIEKCDGSPKAVQEAANLILTEDIEFSAGNTVAVVDDDLSMGGFVGKGKIKSFSEDKGWANVQLPDGSVVQVQTSLLYKTESLEKPAAKQKPAEQKK